MNTLNANGLLAMGVLDIDAQSLVTHPAFPDPTDPEHFLPPEPKRIPQRLAPLLANVTANQQQAHINAVTDFTIYSQG